VHQVVMPGQITRTQSRVKPAVFAHAQVRPYRGPASKPTAYV
jgi:hypothetical protein